jgi:hypothetical protein
LFFDRKVRCEFLHGFDSIGRLPLCPLQKAEAEGMDRALANAARRPVVMVGRAFSRAERRQTKRLAGMLSSVQLLTIENERVLGLSVCGFFWCRERFFCKQFWQWTLFKNIDADDLQNFIQTFS